MWEHYAVSKISPSFLRAKEVIDKNKADAYVYGYSCSYHPVITFCVVFNRCVCGDVRYALSFWLGLSHSDPHSVADTMQHRTPDAI